MIAGIGLDMITKPSGGNKCELTTSSVFGAVCVKSCTSARGRVFGGGRWGGGGVRAHGKLVFLGRSYFDLHFSLHQMSDI